jgi:outer membrane lipoprotein-sorting protein
MTNTKIKLAIGISMAILLVSGAATAVLSSDFSGDSLSSGQICENARAKYASLASYSDEGQIVATMNNTAITTTFTIRLARTNFYRIEWQQSIESAYATNNTQVQAVWSLGMGSHLETGYGLHNEESREIALAKAGEISGGAAGTIPRTFFSTQWGDQLDGSGLNQNRQSDEKVGDIDCYVISRELQGRTKTIWIGKHDFLIHQVRTFTTAEAMQAMMLKVTNGNYEMNSDIHSFTSTETHANIVLNPQFSRSDFIPSSGE